MKVSLERGETVEYPEALHSFQLRGTFQGVNQIMVCQQHHKQSLNSLIGRAALGEGSNAQSLLTVHCRRLCCS